MVITTLDKLQACQFCLVVSLREGESNIIQRLAEFGFVEGASIEVLGFAPLGDPMRVKLSGSTLTLRKHEANLVEVQVVIF